MSTWQNRRVTVMGGASFIGSHLSEALLIAGARVRVVDNFSSGSSSNLRAIRDDIELMQVDLRSPEVARKASTQTEVVFQLAANHGGRGYIDSHNLECAHNMVIDQNVFRGALTNGVEQIVYASSACVYPASAQADPTKLRPLREDMIGPPYEPDGIYGMAKLCGELALAAAHAEQGIGATICRYFTAYGPRCNESHALLAMIARAFVGADPFEIWGTGDQVRTWIHVEDLVRLTLLSAEHSTDAQPVNIATEEAHTVREAAELVLQVTGQQAQLLPLLDKPTGPLARVADISRLRSVVGTEPEIDLASGLADTARWYYETKDRGDVSRSLPHLLTEHARALVG